MKMSVKMESDRYFKYLKESSEGTHTRFPLTLMKSSTEKRNQSCWIPYSVAQNEELKHLNFFRFEDLKLNQNENFELNLIRMNAGIGSSLERSDLLPAHRKNLGAKACDLVAEYKGVKKSLLSWSLYQAQEFYKREKVPTKVTFLVNDETKDIVNEQIHDDLEIGVDFLYQDKMPTLNQEGLWTNEYKAPGGHGYLGFHLLSEEFKLDETSISNKLSVISNGEDLNSFLDRPLLSWFKSLECPFLMITTQKLEKDKKGGQICLEKVEDQFFINILELAQAQKMKEEDFFYDLGLKIGREALFNTNIIVINHDALRALCHDLKTHHGVDQEYFERMIIPDVILNQKKVNSQIYTQLEGAIASVIFKFSKLTQRKLNKNGVALLHLPAHVRSEFFLPLKRRNDYDQLISDFELGFNGSSVLKFRKKL